MVIKSFKKNSNVHVENLNVVKNIANVLQMENLVGQHAIVFNVQIKNLIKIKSFKINQKDAIVKNRIVIKM